MNGVLKYGTWGFLIAVVLVQLIPVERSNPPVLSDFSGPPEVATVLRRACYDCHSHETKWPWYGYVAPVSWLLAHDVEEGREELNFSAWSYHANDAKMKAEIVEEIAEGEMPLPIYRLAHPKAKVTDAELARLRAWAGVREH